MKKIIATIMLLSLSLTLIGCGGENDAKPQDAKQVQTEKAEKSGKYFKDNICQTSDFKIEITEEKVIPVGQKGNEYGQKPVIAFWYKVTNNSDKEIDPSTAWIGTFSAIQDNNANAVNTLQVASLPDERFLETQLQTIKKGGTVENAVAYDLTDETTPVTLVAKDGLLGKELGKQDYAIK